MAVVTCTRRGERTDARIARGGRVEPCHGRQRDHVHADDIHLIEYEGATLGTWEANGYNDSDFYALVWTGEALASVEYATTRGWTYHNGAVADATDEVYAAAREWLAARDIRAWAQATAIDAATPDKGKQVEVVKGRKVPVGTTGEVIWIGEKQWGWRVGIKDADGEVHWTAETNVKVVDPARYMTSLDEIAAKATARAQGIGRGNISGTLKPYAGVIGKEGSERAAAAKQQSGAWVSAYRSYGGALSTRGYHRTDEAEGLVDEAAVEAAITAAAQAVAGVPYADQMVMLYVPAEGDGLYERPYTYQAHRLVAALDPDAVEFEAHFAALEAERRAAKLTRRPWPRRYITPGAPRRDTLVYRHRPRETE